MIVSYLILDDVVGNLFPRVLPEVCVSSLLDLSESVLLDEGFLRVGSFPNEGSWGITVEVNQFRRVPICYVFSIP